MAGFRELIKSGKLTPQEALELIEQSPNHPSEKFIAWCKNRIRKKK